MTHWMVAVLTLSLACGIALGAGAPATSEGEWTLAAHDDCGRAGEQPQLIKNEFDWWIKADEMTQPAPDDARLQTFAVGTTIVYRYANLNPAAAYRLRLFFYNVVHERKVNVLVNDKELDHALELPKEKTLVKEYVLEPASYAGGVAELRIDKAMGRSALVSAIELWRKGEPAKAAEKVAAVEEARPAAPAVEAVKAQATPGLQLTPSDGGAKTLAPIVPAGGETFVFIGDSITHHWIVGPQYTQYIENFFITRYPHAPMHFHNAGVSGSKAEGALQRFEMDVVAQKPKYATVLLGMNDGGYQPFDRGAFERYARDMRTLLDRVAATGAKAIAVSPTWFDYRGVELNPRGERAKLREYDAVLAFYGAWLRDEANARGLGWADVRGPMSEAVNRQRRDEPHFTLAKDSVHPDATGQAVMAAAILLQIQESTRVSEVVAVKNRTGWEVKSEDGKIAEVRSAGETPAFSFTAKSLPWVLPAEALPGLRLVDGERRLAREAVRVVGLSPGSYELKIDGVGVGVYSQEQFAAGVELQGNERTPQYKQAAAVMELNKERSVKAVHEQRKLFEMTKGLPDARAVMKFDAASREYEKKLYEAARPVARKYEVVAAK